MTVELTGILGWVFNFCVLVVIISILLTGTWCILNWFVWNVLVQYSLRYLRLYGTFLHFLKYHKRYLKWAKQYEGKTEPGAND